MQITKANRELQEFDEHKLRRSLKKASIPVDLHDQILEKLQPTLYEGIPTSHIYDTVDIIVSSLFPAGRCTYNLKQAIMKLGPSGFPFERYVAELLSRQGWQVEVGKMMRGRCVSHEVDVVAKQEDCVRVIECKYKSNSGDRPDVKVPLYIQSRFLDIAAGELSSVSQEKIERWVITNTRFSSDARSYGECVGLRMVDWQSPSGESLREMIEKVSLHPITSLTVLTEQHIATLLERGVVFAMDLAHRPELLEGLSFSAAQEKMLANELDQLSKCSI